MKTVVLLSAVMALGACATVTRGTKEVFVVESDPPGAEVSMSNGMSCNATPCSFKVPRKETLVVEVSKEGYDSSSYTVQTQVSGGGGAAMAGNVLVGGLIGVGVDAASGAMLEHKPNPLVVSLQKSATVVASKSEQALETQVVAEQLTEAANAE